MIAGYATAVFGLLSIFKIPLPWPLVIGLAGMLIALAAAGHRYAFTYPRGRRLWIVMLAGPLLMLAVLSQFSDQEMRHWTPHPSGYFPSWWVLVYGVAHIWRFWRKRPKLKC